MSKFDYSINVWKLLWKKRSTKNIPHSEIILSAISRKSNRNRVLLYSAEMVLQKAMLPKHEEWEKWSHMMIRFQLIYFCSFVLSKLYPLFKETFLSIVNSLSNRGEIPFLVLFFYVKVSIRNCFDKKMAPSLSHFNSQIP